MVDIKFPVWYTKDVSNRDFFNEEEFDESK